MNRCALMCALAVAAGCGSVDETPIDPDAAAPEHDARASDGPLFYEDVAPIVYAHCVGCHQPGGIAPFSLIEYDDAVVAAPILGDVVASRQMPPFGVDNSGDCHTYEDARWLDDAEIAVLVAWADGDRAQGDPANAPALPQPQPGIERTDAILDMGVEYVADDSLDDEYRCFVVDPGLATDKFLTALEVLPGNPGVVHHVLLFSLNTPEAEAQAEQLDADTPGPGYQCFGGAGITGLGASTLLGVWAPGTRVSQYPDGTGLPVPGGRKMVMQVHYNLLGGPASDRTRIALQLEDTVALEASIAAVANADLALPPGLASVSSSGTFDIPWFVGDLAVWSVFPHMHTLGRQLRVEIVRDSGTSCATDVPRWDFEWQQFFHYDEPFIVTGQDTLRITCTYDTRGRTETVTWGEGTLDEMCLAFFYVTPE